MQLFGFCLRLFPLAVALIAAATLVPLELRAAQRWTGKVELFDIVDNLLLFAPLGIALVRHRFSTIVAAALVLSMTVEVTQIWQFGRFPSVYDIVANVLGSALAALACRWLLPRATEYVRCGRKEVVLIIATALTTIVIWQLPTRSPALAGWDPGFALLVGNEVTEDRPWKGTVHDLAVWSEALDHADVLALDGNPTRAPVRAPSLLYADDAARVASGGPGLAAPRDVAARIADRVSRSGEISIAVSVTADDASQGGPARIVSFSHDAFHRNFDLGQQPDRVVFRLRTAVTGPNGQRYRTETDQGLVAGTKTRIVATYDGAIARVYVDGVPRARANLAAAGCRVSFSCDSALPLMWSVLGACVAVAVLALRERWTAMQRVGVSLLSAALPIGVEWAVGLMPDGIRSPAWIPLSAFVGSVAVALAYAPPLQEKPISAA